MTDIAQDQAAIKLIKQAGAYNNVLRGEWTLAIAKTNRIWASLPGSPYGQPTFTLKKALDFIKANALIFGPGALILAGLLVFF
jgi:muramidase (phage lysozyme)